MKRNSRRLICVGISFLSCLSLMFSPTGFAESTDIKLKVLMHSFLTEMEKLRPFLATEKDFGNPKSQKTIAAAIEMLQLKATGDTPETIERNSGFRLNYGMLKYHIRKTKEAYDLGALELARQNLNATGAICLGCHSQLPKQNGKPVLVWAQLDKSKKLTLEAAEYLFVMRNFDGALTAYDDLVHGFPENQLEPGRLPELYRRKLALLARVQRDPAFAIKNLTKDLSNAKLPADIRGELKSWIGYFQQWQKESVNPESLSTEKLLRYVKENLPEGVERRIAPADSEVVRYLRLSGLIYERLLREPGTAVSQELVYRLAIIEKQLSKKYWYSLHQAYLRECVIGFPKSATSKICFETYVKDIEEQFAGRSQIPPGAQSTIDSLKKYVD